MANGWPNYDKKKYISRHGITCVLGISYRLIDIYVEAEVLDPPVYGGPQLRLYKRAQVMALGKYLGFKREQREIAWKLGFAKLKRHLTRDECAPPSTWWYQAREIAAHMISHPRHWRCPAREKHERVTRLPVNALRKRLYDQHRRHKEPNAEPQDSVCALYSTAADYLEATRSERWQIQMARQKANAESERRARLGDQSFRTEIAP